MNMNINGNIDRYTDLDDDDDDGNGYSLSKRYKVEGNDVVQSENLIEKIQQLEKENERCMNAYKVLLIEREAVERRMMELEKELEETRMQKNYEILSTSVLPINIMNKIKENVRASFSTGSIDFSDCGIEDWMMREMLEWIDAFGSNVCRLNLSNNKITNHGAEMVLTHAKKWPGLNTLDMSGNEEITDELIPFLSEGAKSTNLSCICIKNTSVSIGDIHGLLIAVKTFAAKMKSLGLNDFFRELNDAVIMKICQVIQEHPNENLENVIIRNSKITTNGLSLLLKALKQYNPAMSHLYLNKIQMNVIYMGIVDTEVEILTPFITCDAILEELDISENKGVTDVSIPFLRKMIQSSNVKSINFKDTSISSAKILQIDYIIKNAIKVSSELNLEDKQVTDKYLIQLCGVMKNYSSSKINKIKLSKNKITSKGASLLFDTIKECKIVVEYLDLFDNQIDDECIKPLGECLQAGPYILGLGMHKNKITDKGIELLSYYLIGNTTITQLHLASNEGVTGKSAPFIMRMIQSSLIAYMNFEETCFTQLVVFYLPLLENIFKKSIETLNLTIEGLNDEDLMKICGWMKKYGIDKLKRIDLGRNNVTSKGASVLFDTLKEYNSVVSYLNLTNNQLDDECMKQLGEYLQDNEYVEQLILGSIKITDKGVGILSEHLSGNTTLKELFLSFNDDITDVSVPYLIELVNKSCITKIDINFTSLSYEMTQEIDKAVSIPIEEREIPIKSNTKSAAKIQSSSVST